MSPDFIVEYAKKPIWGEEKTKPPFETIGYYIISQIDGRRYIIISTVPIFTNIIISENRCSKMPQVDDL